MGREEPAGKPESARGGPHRGCRRRGGQQGEDVGSGAADALGGPAWLVGWGCEGGQVSSSWSEDWPWPGPSWLCPWSSATFLRDTRAALPSPSNARLPPPETRRAQARPTTGARSGGRPHPQESLLGGAGSPGSGRPAGSSCSEQTPSARWEGGCGPLLKPRSSPGGLGATLGPSSLGGGRGLGWGWGGAGPRAGMQAHRLSRPQGRPEHTLPAFLLRE